MSYWSLESIRDVVVELGGPFLEPLPSASKTAWSFRVADRYLMISSVGFVALATQETFTCSDGSEIPCRTWFWRGDDVEADLLRDRLRWLIFGTDRPERNIG